MEAMPDSKMRNIIHRGSKIMSRKSKANDEMANYIIDGLASDDPITTRPMFGALALYRNGHVFAMAWEGSLYFKVDETTQTDYEAANSHALEYVSRGEQHSLKSFWEVPADVIEDEETLRKWANKAYEAAMKSAKH